MHSTGKRSTCVCVLNWRTPDATIECVESIIRSSRAVETIIVCDNGSHDTSRRELIDWASKQYRSGSVFPTETGDVVEFGRPEAPEFVFIENEANLGYAGGHNRAVGYALHQKRYTYIWILNSDVSIEAGALEKLCQYLEDDETVGIAGSTVVYKTDTSTLQCAGGCTYNPLTTVYRPVCGGEQLEHIDRCDGRDMDYVSGASFFVRERVFRECGLFNEDYFLFYEELDFCTRVLGRGYELGWCKDSVVMHQGGASIKLWSDVARKREKFTEYHENLSTLLFTRRFHNRLLPVAMIYRFCAKLILNLCRRRWHVCRAVVDAYRDFLTSVNQRGDYR